MRNKFLTKILGATLGLAMALGVGVGVAANNRVAKGLDASTSATLSAGSNSAAIKVNYNSAGAPASNNGVRVSTSGSLGSASFSVPSNTTSFGFSAVGWKDKSVTATISASVGTPSETSISLTSNSAATGSISANATVAINGDDEDIKKSFTITGVTSASTITLSTSSTEKRAIFWDAWYEVTGGGVTLGTPAPEYSAGFVTWADIENASSYDVTVAGFGTMHNATSPFSTSALPVPGAYTVSVTAIGNGTTYLDSLPGSTTFAKLNKAGTEAEPYDVANARAAIDGNAKVANVYVTGVISQVDEFDDEHKSITYWISDDGTTTNQFEVYSGKGLNGADFASIDDVEVGATVVVYGTIKKYQDTYEFNYNNELKAYTAPDANVSVSNKETASSLTYRYSASFDDYSDTLTRTLTGVSGTSYTNWSNKKDASGNVYAGNSAGPTSGNGANSIQLRSTNSSGIITTSSSGKALKVTVTWHNYTTAGRTIDIYGKNFAYSATSDLFSASTQGTKLGSIVKGTSTELELDGSYKYIGIRSNDGALYLSSIKIDWNIAAYTYSNVAVKFGGQISTSLWNRLNTESHGIVGYGVMLTEPSVLEHEGYDTIEELYEDVEYMAGSIDAAREEVDGVYYITDSPVKYFYNEISTAPRSADGKYVWDLVKSVNGTKKGLTREYTAVAFIRTTDDGLVFLQETTKSAAQVADDIYTAELDETLDGSLGNLALLA